MKLLERLRPTILDRYIIAEILPPMGLGMMLFSFVLLLDPISRLTSSLVARGADIPTVLGIFLNLLPSILATTVPMSFLLGVLVAFGRLASESEIIAMRASGMSGTPLLRPVLLLSLVAGAVTLYIMTVALPEANQSFRQQVFAIVIGKARSAVVPRVFDTKLLPNMVIYAEDVSSETGQWHNVFLHDTRIPKKPRVILAATGEPRINRERKQAELHLEHGVIHAFDTEEPENYRQQSFVTLDSPLDFRQIFPETSLSRGDREMTLSQLEDRMAELRSEEGTEKEIARFEVEWHKRFAIPTACIVFGLLGVGLSLGSRKEARSSAFAISIVVIFVYYVLLRLGEQAGDTGLVPPILGMWSANVVLGAVGILLLVLNHREAAFDPLDPSHYTSWIPKVRRAERAPRRHQPQPIRVVVRVPRVSLPTPSLLDRYILRLYATHFFLVLAAVVSLFFLAEFMDLIDDVQQNHVKGIVVARYYVFHILFIVYQMIPMAVLVTPLVTFGLLSRNNETTAIKAGGVSLYRAVLPVIVAGTAIAISLFAMGDYMLPETNRMAQRQFNIIKGRPPQTSSLVEQRWILGSDGRSIYNYDYLSERNLGGHGGHGRSLPSISLYGLSVFEVDPETWSLQDRLFVSQATWKDEAYDLEGGWRLGLSGESPRFRSFDRSRTREIEPPDYFLQEAPPADTLTFGELSAHIGALEKRGFDVARLKVQLHRKIAFPAIAVVMTLIGIPFSFVVGRRGALYGIGISLLIAVVYWTTLTTFEGFGNHGQLPPLLAAWAANIIFAAGGAYLLLTLET